MFPCVLFSSIQVISLFIVISGRRQEQWLAKAASDDVEGQRY